MCRCTCVWRGGGLGLTGGDGVAGTEDVFFVDSRESARRAFDTIIGKTNLFGEVNASVLVQVG